MTPTATLAVHCGNDFNGSFSPLSKYSFEPLGCFVQGHGAIMQRRYFLGVLGGAAVWPLTARAQQTDRMRRIGWLVALRENDPEAQRRTGAFVQQLQQLGWTVGRNILIEYRWLSENVNQTQAYAEELARLQPDVLVATSTPAVNAMRQQTRTIPIVFAFVTDPVSSGLVTSLARGAGRQRDRIHQFRVQYWRKMARAG